MRDGRQFCRDCGHWEHDPGSCDGLGHHFNGDSPVVTDCACEVYDDQRPDTPEDRERAAVAAHNLLGVPMLHVRDDCWCYSHADAILAALRR